MCGRFTLRTSPQAVAQHFGVAEFPLFEPRYNIAPTQSVVAVRAAKEGAGREMCQLRWGLVPSWANDPAVGNRMINARADTAAEKPSFRTALRRRRCLVAADGFFEWRAEAGKKQPYYIARTDGGVFAIAGLWEYWKREGQVIESCTLLTTEANPLMQQLHDRMPVILSPQNYDAWLDPQLQQAEPLAPLMVPYGDDDLEFRPVSTWVNKPANQGPQCIEPIAAA